MTPLGFTFGLSLLIGAALSALFAWRFFRATSRRLRPLSAPWGVTAIAAALTGVQVMMESHANPLLWTVLGLALATAVVMVYVLRPEAKSLILGGRRN